MFPYFENDCLYIFSSDNILVNHNGIDPNAFAQLSPDQQQQIIMEYQNRQQQAQNNENFDYSDFDIDDEDI